jgi:hypothetical protein
MPYDVDENTLLHPMKMWNGYGDDKPDPPVPPNPLPTEDEVSYFRYTPEGFVAEIHMGYKKYISGDYFYGVVQGQLQGSGVTSPTGIYATPAPRNLIDAIPDEGTSPPAVVDTNAIAQAVRDKLRSDPLK